MSGRTLVMIGAVLILVGGLWMLAEKLGFGRLPGDIVVRKNNFTLYVPLVSSIVVSLVVTLLLNLFRR